jgi:hypothetical protein
VKRIKLLAAMGLLGACTTTAPTPAPFLDLAVLKSDPDESLRLYKDKRIRTAGYFQVSLFDPTCWGDANPKPQAALNTWLDLDLPMRTFSRAARRWVVIEATVRQPVDMELGGGDLVILVPAWQQDFYLNDAKLIEIDESKPAC